MRIESTDIRLSHEDLEDIQDLNIPLTKPELSEQFPSVVASALVNTMPAGCSSPSRSEKWWGFELTYFNDPSYYTMKVLHFNNAGHTSMHYHIDKHETLLVVSGVLTLETLFNKERNYYRLGPGTAWIVPPGYAHRLIAAEGPVTLVESSTYDTKEDSIRLS